MKHWLIPSGIVIMAIVPGSVGAGLPLFTATKGATSKSFFPRLSVR
jgi:hypothetical protein